MRLANVRDGSKAEMAADGRAASRYHALMLDLSCHCGLVRLTIERRPDYIHACTCTLCRKTGALWGYFPSAMVGVQGTPSHYPRTDNAEPGAEITHCGTRGVTTHFRLPHWLVARFGQDV